MKSLWDDLRMEIVHRELTCEEVSLLLRFRQG